MFKFTYYNNKSQIIDIFLPILNTVFLRMNISSWKHNHPLPVFSVFFQPRQQRGEKARRCEVSTSTRATED